MAVLRKTALGLVLAASAAVLLMAGWELWNYRQLASLPLRDVELLVLILLGTSGLYAIVFIGSSYLSATSFARQADQTVGHLQDQIGVAMGDLRQLREETEQRLRQMTAPPVTESARDRQPAGWEARIAEITVRLAAYQDAVLSEQSRLELIEDENTTAYLEVVAGARAGSSLAGLYLEFGRVYSSSDSARSRFYLERALRLATPESSLVSEIHYQLACTYAESHDFARAMRELAAAFEHQFKTLDERLATDIEEGGKLYVLASNAPFDKAVNDLLLNMSIGIG